jgi:hypothetical protein
VDAGKFALTLALANNVGALRITDKINFNPKQIKDVVGAVGDLSKCAR